MTANRALFVMLVLPLLAGCAQRYYYTKPAASYTHFTADHAACVREVGIPSANGAYALVSPPPYRACMRTRGWTREERTEPAGVEWFRGVENEGVVEINAPPRPMTTRTPSSEALCRQTYLAGRSAWRDALPAYYACLEGR